MGNLENHGRLSASFNLNNKKGKIMDVAKNKRSNGRGTKSLSKSLFNSIVFGKEIIMKKIKMKKRFGLNRQKSRSIVENVLSGTKAGYKAILNFEHSIERKKMDNQKSKSTFSATLPALILGLIVLWTGLAAVAAEKKYVTDPTTGKVVTAPEYGGTLTIARKEEGAGADVAVHWGAEFPRPRRCREAGHRGLGNAQGQT